MKKHESHPTSAVILAPFFLVNSFETKMILTDMEFYFSHDSANDGSARLIMKNSKQHLCCKVQSPYTYVLCLQFWPQMTFYDVAYVKLLFM